MRGRSRPTHPSFLPRNLDSSSPPPHQITENQISSQHGAITSSTKKDAQQPPLPEAAESPRWRKPVHVGARYAGAERWPSGAGVCKTSEGTRCNLFGSFVWKRIREQHAFAIHYPEPSRGLVVIFGNFRCHVMSWPVHSQGSGIQMAWC